MAKTKKAPKKAGINFSGTLKPGSTVTIDSKHYTVKDGKTLVDKVTMKEVSVSK